MYLYLLFCLSVNERQQRARLRGIHASECENLTFEDKFTSEILVKLLGMSGMTFRNKIASEFLRIYAKMLGMSGMKCK